MLSAKKKNIRKISSFIKFNKMKTKIKKKKKSSKKEIFIAIAGKTISLIVYVVGIVLSLFVLFFIYINLPAKENSEEAKIGVTFSSLYAQQIGLDWKQAYLAMVDDLKIRYVRLPVYWDRVEKTEGEYDFADIDWQLEQARIRGVKIILVVGQKVPRWPECYVPAWVGSDPSNLDQARLREKLLTFEDVVIKRYKNNHPEIERWQVENEPFLDFGICSKVNPDLLDAEIAQVRKLDSTRPIVVTDSGELSLWVQAAKRADVFGTTMYREVYSQEMGHWRYPIGPNFFKIKQLIISLFANQKNAVIIELQGEPWVGGWTTSAPIETQLASMNPAALEDNVSFAKKTGMNEIYLWGVEWWYWMKVTQNNPTLWESARTFIK